MFDKTVFNSSRLRVFLPLMDFITTTNAHHYGFDLFQSAPSKVLNFNTYQPNEEYTWHIDASMHSAVRDIKLTCLLNCSEEEYQGGDLYLFISIDNHNIFKRSDENLYYELPISFSDATLGTSVAVPSIDGGKSKIKIPSGTQHGKQFRLKGKGMPVLRRSIFGDLYIRVVIQVPTSLSKRQKEILEEFNEIESNKPDPVIKSFFEKAKKFWRKT